jgi:predicted transcriptional regulator of viral defense system
MTKSALGQLADVAEAQNGLFTARQAGTRGVPRRDLVRLAQAGALERIAYGVYRVAGAPRPKQLELRAAWLQLAPGIDLDRRTVADGVVSHTSAASVYEVGLLEPTRHEFSVPQSRRLRSRRNDVIIYRRRLTDDDVDWVEEMLVTVPTRMVDDLCTQSMDGEHLAGVVADLLDKRLASRRGLAAALAPHADRYGGQPDNGRQFLGRLLSLAPTRSTAPMR